MHIKAKLYPYPVLSSFNNDYVDSSFDINVEAQANSDEVLLRMIPELVNDQLLQTIENNDAIFAVHLECALTSYRQVVEVPFEGVTVSISANKVEGKIIICPFIVAARDIYDYDNEKFNDEYQGVTFDLDRGSIMALGKEKSIEIEKQYDDLANIPSIFAVTEILDPNQEDITIDYSGDKICLRLVSKVYRKFVSQNSNNINAQPILHAMLIIPALVKCLEDVKHSGDDYYQFAERRWYKSIVKAAKKLNIELNECTIQDQDTFELAQKLMKNTTSNGIVNLHKVAIEGGNLDED